MKYLLQLLICSITTAAVAVAGLPANAQSIPKEQRHPPATMEGQYPYRPSCLQLIPQLSVTNPTFTAWGPYIGGKHQVWYGLPTGMDIGKAISELDALGLCVKGGEVVPWQVIGGIVSTIEGRDYASPLEANVERLKSAPDARNSSDTGAGVVIFIALAAAGGIWLMERFENKPWMQRLMGETVIAPASAVASSTQIKREAPRALPTADELPDRISQEALRAGQQQQTALSVLVGSPFVSRAFYGFQRTGKTNLVATAMQQLAQQGIHIYSLNLNSFGTEDDIYWRGFHSVRGDLTTISDSDEAQQLIKKAIALVNEFMADPSPSILVVDEWAPMTASHSEHIALLEPLIKSLANKITGFSSSGMKRKKAIYTIASEIVAGTMEEFGKAVKKLSVCLVGIAPGHTVQWEGQSLTFSWELYSQVNKNYPGVLSQPPEDAAASRIAFIDNEWRDVGTTALVKAGVATVAQPSDSHSTTTLPTPAPLSTELQLFRQWLDKKIGETINLQMFKNARVFREKVERSERQYLILCDQAVMKGWLSQFTQHSFYVLE